MKLAALQLMQQKASKMESSATVGNGSPPSLESEAEDPLGPEAGSEEEGSSASGLAKVKELAETIASDDGTGGAAVDAGRSPRPVLALVPATGCSRPSPERAGRGLRGAGLRTSGPLTAGWAGGMGLPSSGPCLHSRPTEPGGDPQRVQGSRLHQQHGLRRSLQP